MVFLGTLINFALVFISGTVGSFVKKGVPEKISQAVISAMGVAVIYIGIDGALEKAPSIDGKFFLSAGLVKMLIMILSVGIGTIIGELIDIDKRMNKLGVFLEKKLTRGASGGNFAKGFASCSILFCVGAMAVNGAIDDALGKPDILIAKSAVDAIMVFVMASTLGIGCAFSAFSVLLYQGSLTLIAWLLAAVIPAETITYMSVTGSLIIILIGTNMLGMTKVKTANMIPAIFIPLLTIPFFV